MIETPTVTAAGWWDTTLGKFIRLQRGFDLPATRRRPGRFKVLSSGGIAGSHDEGPVPGPGLVIGRATNLGVPTWSDEDYWPLNTTLFVKDFNGNDPRFAYYLLRKLDLSGFNSGSVQPMLNRNYVANVPLCVPQLREQRGISSVLRALDDKIESNRRIVLVAEDQLTALSELSAHEDSPRVELGESVVVVKEAIRPTVLGSDVVEHFSLPAFDASATPDHVTADTVLSNKLRVPGPCILLSRLNPRTDRTWYVEPDRPAVAMASTEFLVLTARPGTSIGAVWLALRAPEFRASLIRRVTGTSGSHQRVKPADVLSIETLDARSIDADRWLAADQLLAVIHQRRVESQRMIALRDALLPELLSGRIRVPEAREAVAEVVDAHD